MARYAENTVSDEAPLEPGKQTFFAGQQWSLTKADAQAVDGFYCPDPVCLSCQTQRSGHAVRGRAVSIEDLLRDLRVPAVASLCYAACGARFGDCSGGRSGCE